MSFIFNILSELQAAIAVVAARERHLTVLLVAAWGRIGRMRSRLERLVAHWRAGTLPKPRASRAGEVRATPRQPSTVVAVPAWVWARVDHLIAFQSQLEHVLSEAECAEFLAAVPRAGRIFRPLLRMVRAGLAARRVRAPRPEWALPDDAPKMVQGGLVLGPDGRLMYV